MFVVLGSYLFFGSGEELSSSSADFAHQVVTLYTETIGPWSSLVISASAFAVMFGTILAILDGYTRSVKKVISLMVPGMEQTRLTGNFMNITLLVLLSAGSSVVIFGFGNNLLELVDFATVLSFIVFPIIAFFHIRLVGGRHLDKAARPHAGIRILSYVGVAFMGVLAAVFLFVRFL